MFKPPKLARAPPAAPPGGLLRWTLRESLGGVGVVAADEGGRAVGADGGAHAGPGVRVAGDVARGGERAARGGERVLRVDLRPGTPFNFTST